MLINKERFKFQPNEDYRDSWVCNLLEQIPEGTKILDVGAGDCKYKKYCSHLKYTSQDLCEYNGTGNDEGLQTKEWDTSQIDIVSDIANIPVEDNCFDVILCTEVFEHIFNPIEVIEELTRILRKDGQLIITAPFCSLTHFAPFHFYSGYNKYFYQTALAEKYEIIKLESYGNWFEYIGSENLRLKNTVELYAETKINLWDKILLGLLSLRYKKYSKMSKKSEELLCWGYLCIAKKR